MSTNQGVDSQSEPSGAQTAPNALHVLALLSMLAPLLGTIRAVGKNAGPLRDSIARLKKTDLGPMIQNLHESPADIRLAWSMHPSDLSPGAMATTHGPLGPDRGSVISIRPELTGLGRPIRPFGPFLDRIVAHELAHADQMAHPNVITPLEDLQQSLSRIKPNWHENPDELDAETRAAAAMSLFPAWKDFDQHKGINKFLGK